MSKKEQQEIEWRAWGVVCVRLKERGIIVNDPSNDLLIYAIQRWGEELAQLRWFYSVYAEDALEAARDKSPHLAESVDGEWTLTASPARD